MRQRSITGPLIIVMIGILLLINNVRPDLLAFSRIADYWPFFLIAAGVIGLIEVLFHASHGSTPPPRPLSGGLIFWILILCLFFGVFNRNRDFRFAGFDPGGVGFLGTDYDYDVNATEPAQGVTRIVLDNLRGDISVKGDDSGEIKVTGHQTVRAFNRNAADRAKSQTSVQLERHGDELLIRTEDSGGSRLTRISADLDISIPRGFNVESRGRTGDLTIDGLDGGVDISNGRGDVRLNHIGKDVRIDSSRGGDIHVNFVQGAVDLQGRGSDLEIGSITGPVTIKGEYSGDLEFHALSKPLEFNSSHTEFHLEAIPGTVNMDLGDLKMSNVAGPVRFQSGTRDIQITDVTDLVDLKVDRGDIEVTQTQVPLPKIDIHTRNGDVTLAIPEKAGFQLNGSTSQGEIESGFGSQLQVETFGRSATIKGQNGAGPQITVVTDRGTISVKKN
jgi:DUF4097 and DUF4098 domain-containing protein YvlB